MINDENKREKIGDKEVIKNLHLLRYLYYFCNIFVIWNKIKLLKYCNADLSEQKKLIDNKYFYFLFYPINNAWIKCKFGLPKITFIAL